jgi:hypothetical protein
MSRRKPNAAPVTLFPFLAVLMCTMGALIVLLVLVSAQVRDDAVAKAQEERDSQVEPEPPSEQVPLLPVVSEPEPILVEAKPLPPMPNLEGLRRILAELDERERSLRNALADRDAKLAALNAAAEAALRETALAAAQRKQLEANLKLAVRARQAALNELSELDSERARLLASIRESKVMIEQRQRELNADNEFVIIPFDGKSGTSRRPIIIECTDRAIRFVSEEIELTPNQLLGFTPQNNPLLAGANEIVRFWATRNSVQEDPESEPVPYVLLVVRPSGTVGFYLARKFLAGLGADHGYELIEEDFDYSAPPSDPRAREMALAAIAEMLATGRSRNEPSTFSESLAAGGSTPGGNTGRGQPGGRGTFSGMTNSGRDMRSFDSRVLRHGAGPASSGFFNSNDFQKHQDGVGREPGAGRPGTRLTESPSRFGSGKPGSGNRGGLRTGVGQGSSGKSGVVSGSSVAGGAVGDSSAENQGVGGTGASDLPIGLQSTPQLGALGGASGQSAPPKPFDFSTGQEPLIAASGDPRSSSGTGPNEQSASDGPGRRGTKNGETTQTDGDSLTTERGPDGRPAGSASARRSPPGSVPGQRTRSTAARAAQSASSGGGSPGSASEGTPESQLTMSASPRSSTQRRRPLNVRRQWGIRNPSGTIALEKSIVIFASQDKVVIDRKFKITRTVDRAPGQIIDWTILAMDKVAGEWGVPPRRFYWVPAVTLVIEPGGDLLRGPLEDKLRRSGVSVETRFSDASVFESPAGGAP